ncbi:Grn protein [Fasciola hepatica]|uniref:Grn protein n=1 Tax=Fasciola hepatica TaxID=6192 RepID=A0A4E0RCP9_FASHE|nr:Grn protein [Fasciola hepatica]
MACRVALPFILFSVCFISSSCQSSDCDNSSYCQTKGGVLQNCPYKDGVCCGDDRHCCPKGTVCDIEGQRCKVTNGEAFSIRNLIQCPKTSRNDEFRSVQLVDPSNARSPVLCPDRKAACPDQSTCCPMSGGWGCCEHPNAVCCSDHSHCCPQGYQCDTTKASCIPSNRVSNFMYGFLSMLSRLPTLRQAQTVDSQSLPLARTYEMCEDHRYQCPRGTSCCPTQSGSYACCPMPDAVCCSDGIHCCPKDTICDMASGQCLGSSIKVAAVVPVRPHDPVIIPMVDPQACPDAKYSCLNNQTCCQLKSGEWGCCPIPQAVCCSDHEHCCPSGFHCDTARGMCVRGSLVTTVPSASVKQVCPDPEWQCDDNTTCCELGNKEWGCCDMPNAVCCEDKAHCCPENYQCDIKRNLCTKADATSFLFTGIQTPVKIC